jgi:plastocyanin
MEGMMKLKVASVVIAVLLTAVALAGCGCGRPPTPPISTGPPKPAPTTPSTAPGSTTPGAETSMTKISVKNLTFTPAEVTVNTGATVAWANEDSVAHTITGTGFDSGEIQPGMEFRHTFSAPGTYDYHCSIHPAMTGKVIVQ